MDLPATPRVTADDVLQRLAVELDRAPLHATGPLLASDADGTIWDGDVGYDLFEALLAARGVRDEARDALADEARAIGASPEGDANTLAVRLYEAFKDERYPHDRAFAMMAWIFAGWRADELSAFTAKVLSDGRIDTRIRPKMLDIFRWAEGRGVAIYVVSASPRAIIESAAPRLGIPRDRLVAMTPRVSAEGVVLPSLEGPIVYGEGKVKALQSALAREGSGKPNLLGAFGDSTYDAAMLRASRVPVAVTPSAGLVALLPTIPGVVTLDLTLDR
jgi:phosphatidylglycerophosphatase C